MGNRKAFESFVLEYIEKILPGSGNKEHYSNYFKSLSDKAFDKFVDTIEANGGYLPFIVPNFNTKKLDTKRNIEIAKELGYDFIQHLWLTDSATGQVYKTPKKYLVLDLPVRRQQQHITKKRSVAKDNHTRDVITGQPVGKSKAGSLSLQEIQVLYALGLEKTITELIKVRGGDVDAFNAMNKQMVETGGASIDSIEAMGTSPSSVEAVGALLTGMNLDNTL